MSIRALGGDSARLAILLIAFSAATSGCNSGGGSDGGTTGGTTTAGTTGGTTGGYTVTISSYTFAPDPIVVPAGATITFKNMDSMVHTATSEAAAGNYVKDQVDGGFTFDTTSINVGASAMVTVPSTIASGTVQPYFCTNHKSAMANPNPTIHIQ
jgi:plastocyanin